AEAARRGRARRIELERLFEGLARLDRILETIASQLAEIGVELGLADVPLGHLDLAEQQLRRAVGIAAAGVDVAERGRCPRVGGAHIERSLVARDGSVPIAALF